MNTAPVLQNKLTQWRKRIDNNFVCFRQIPYYVNHFTDVLIMI